MSPLMGGTGFSYKFGYYFWLSIYEFMGLVIRGFSAADLCVCVFILDRISECR